MAHLMDSLVKNIAKCLPANWLPYNIDKEGEANYRITMAVAGFAEPDLDITLHEQVLTITGTQPQDDTGDREVLYRGIVARQFERRFQLDDFIHIKSAELKDGLLHIYLVREIPEAMKPRKIAINSADTLVDIKKRKKAS